MFAAIISLIVGLISAFASKKKEGTSNTKAALIGAAAAAGTYYVATETQFGQSAVSALEETFGVSSAATVTQTAPDGTSVQVTPAPAVSTVTAPGAPARISVPSGSSSSNSTLGAMTTATADVLKSWGGVGTAAVIGTTAAATTSKFSQYLPWLAGGLLILLIMR